MSCVVRQRFPSALGNRQDGSICIAKSNGMQFVFWSTSAYCVVSVCIPVNLQAHAGRGRAWKELQRTETVKW